MAEEKQRVVVGLSGGVDSTLAASLLIEQGYEVIGVTLRLLPCTESGERRSCCGLDGVSQARAVAGQLGIRHYTADCHDAFTENVLKSSWESYAIGQTPNPCVLCNRHIKFGWLMDFANKVGASHVATGHYSRIAPDANGDMRLWRGEDKSKDQSYFLFALTKDQIAHALMPLGGYSKPTVRVMATERGYVNANRQDSQDVCFAVDNGGFPEFMRQRFGELSKPGVLIDDEGNVLGEHDGIHKFTLGQRKGIGVALGKPAFVRSIDAETGRVVITTDKNALYSNTLQVRDLVWHGREVEPGSEVHCEVQTRYRQEPVKALAIIGAGQTASIVLESSQHAITPGQCAVMYQGELVLGGGWIR
jgi:tRNA-specific 2-thiouridylase